MDRLVRLAIALLAIAVLYRAALDGIFTAPQLPAIALLTWVLLCLFAVGLVARVVLGIRGPARGGRGERGLGVRRRAPLPAPEEGHEAHEPVADVDDPAFDIAPEEEE